MALLYTDSVSDSTQGVPKIRSSRINWNWPWFIWPFAIGLEEQYYCRECFEFHRTSAKSFNICLLAKNKMTHSNFSWILLVTFLGHSASVFLCIRISVCLHLCEFDTLGPQVAGWCCFIQPLYLLHTLGRAPYLTICPSTSGTDKWQQASDDTRKKSDSTLWSPIRWSAMNGWCWLGVFWRA